MSLTLCLKTADALRRARSGPAGPHLDDFVAYLGAAGYARDTLSHYLGSAIHLGRWLERQRIQFHGVDEEVCRSYRRHLRRCRCGPRFGRRPFRCNVDASGHFLAYLRQVGIAACRAAPLVADHPLLDDFERWMRVHRGLADDTLARYRSLVMELLETLGNDPRQFDARRIRAFVIAQARRGPGRVKDVGLATRAFLRHLSTLGRCPTSLLDAVPAMAVWRLARLPKYLSAADVARVIASCRPATTAGSRDRAVLLLLARLALRAGDIVAMRIRDIDWREGTITVMGKSQRQSRLPLPQDAGDAILAYLRNRPKVPTDRLFLRVHAPWRPLSKRGTVSAIVRGAIRRAGVDAPCLGAHVLRHSAATEMLRRGVSLEAIGSVLRHRSIETTAIYTKVDVDLLQRVVQPWPGSSS